MRTSGGQPAQDRATAAVRTDAWVETPLVFQGRQGPLVGIVARPTGLTRAAMLIVAGQPQTRVGAHRMFTDLARALAARGVASLRFDVGGWGDSPGEPLPFEGSDVDIVAAARVLRIAVPTPVPLWVWGLCDGASAAVFALAGLRAAGVEPQVLCLVNPWVRSEAGLSAAMVKRYYARRLFERDFWVRLATGRISWRNLVREPLGHLARQFGFGTRTTPAPSGARPPAAGAPPHVSATGRAASGQAPGGQVESAAGGDIPTQMLRCLRPYRGAVLTVLSGADLTAGETETLMRRSREWRKRLAQRGRLLRVAGADHTFSDPAHWAGVCDWLAVKAGAPRVIPGKRRG